MVDETFGLGPQQELGPQQAPATIAASTPEEEGAVISLPSADTPISATAAANRANKYSIGMPNSSVDNQTALSKILQQRERELRDNAAAEVDFQKTVENNQRIQDIISKQTKEQGPLSLPTKLMIRDLVNRKASNPNTVIEENYAEQFTKKLQETAANNPYGELAEAFKNLPMYTQTLTKSATDLKARYERIQSLTEEAQAAFDKQSTTGYVFDQLKNFTAVYQEAKYRGLVKGGITTYLGGPLGNNIESQWNDLLTLPFEDFNTQVTNITKKLISDNPSAAMFWLTAAHGLSSEDRLLTNMAPVLDFGLATDLIGVGAKIPSLLRVRLTANKAFKTIVDAQETIASKAAITEASGDIRGAAVEQFANEVMKGPSQKQVTNTLDDIAGVFEQKSQALADMGAPGVNGTMRQEFVNRLREQVNKLGTNLMSRVENLMKLEQIPAAAAIPRVLAKMAEAMGQDYPGLSNSIVKNNMFRDTTTGQWFYEGTIGGAGGRGFASEKVAREFASQKGLGDYEIKEIFGPGAPKTVSTTKTEQGKYLSTEAANEVFNFSKDWHPSFKPTDLAPPPTSEIKQQGATFYITKTKPLPLNASYVRDFLLETTATQTPNKILNAASSILGRLRTPEETLAVENMINRKLAVYSANKYYEVFKDTMKDINALPGWKLPFTKQRADWKEWKEVMTAMDNVPNARTGEKGIEHAFDTPGELRDLYIQIKNRPPSEAEVSASFAYRNQALVQQTLAQLTKLKDHYRQGAQWVTFKGLEETTGKGLQAGVVKTSSTSAIPQKQLPTSADSTVLFLHNIPYRAGEQGSDLYHSVNETIVRNGARLPGSKLAQSIEDDIAQGKVRVFQIVEPDTKPLKNLYNPAAVIHGPNGEVNLAADLRITHVAIHATNVEDRLLSLGDIKVNPLPKHDYGHYVVQPVINYNPVTRMHEYIGDRTIAGFNVRGMASQMADGLDKMRELIKSGQYTAARNYHAKSKLPLDYSEIESWFGTEASEGATRLNLDHSVRVVPNGKLSIDVDKSLERYHEAVKAATGQGFKDWTRESFGQVKTHDPYDIFTANNTGTKANPIWNVGETKYVDPIVSINRGLTRSINDLSLNDYKATSVEHWLQEAKDLLDFSDSTISNAPRWVFHQADKEMAWKGGLSPVNEMKKLNLQTAQMQINQFLGIKDINTTFIHNAAQILSDRIYDRLGQGRTLLALESTLPFLKDPFEYARAMTFHAKVGLFAVPQLLVQMSTITAMAGIAGWDKAAMGTHAMTLHTWARINRNPEIINFFDQKATALGFKPGQFKEAFEILDSTGFAIPGREQMWQDRTSFMDFIKHPAGVLLDAGQWFYKEGERASRTTAWYTAYQEFRELNPIRKITDTDKRWILNRADLLNQNMSTASASAIQKGVWSLPTQFLSFPIRQAELMLGHRLTPIEQGRLFGTYALFYGIPTALGAFTLGIGGDLMKSSLASSGYVSGAKTNTPLDTVATQGLLSFLLHKTTGNMYNIGERFAGGSSPVIDALFKDKGFMEVMGGASGSTVYKTIAGMDGILTATMSAMKGVDKFRFKPEDFIDPFRQIVSVNSTDRLYQAVQFGKWLSTSGQEMSKVSNLDAVFMTVTGLSRQTAADLGPVMWNKDYEKKQQNSALKDFIREYQKGIKEFTANNPEQGHDYLSRAYRILILKGYPKEDWPKAVAIAQSGEENLPIRIMSDYYNKHVPPDEVLKRHEAGRQFIQSGQQ